MSIIKKILSFLILIPIILTFSSCDFLKDKEYKVSYDLKAEPKNLDPQTATDKASLTVINNIFEGLVSVDKTGKILPAAAESYNCLNDVTYTFTLRKNLKWEDDSPLTAHDFVFAFRRLIRSDTNSDHAIKYFAIKNAAAVNSGDMPETELGVIAKSDTDLEITINKPNKHFLMLLAQTPAMPCNEKFFIETNGKYGLEPTTILSNGAYKLGSWKHKEYIRLDKNDEYYLNDSSAAKGVSLWINTDKTVNDEQVYNSPSNRLIDGNVASAIVDGFDIDTIPSDKFDIVQSQETSYGLVFNQNSKYLSNKNLRLAISHAFDRTSYEKQLITAESGNSCNIAYAIIPHSIYHFGEQFRTVAGDNVALPYNTGLAFELYKSALTELGAETISTLKMITIKNEKMPITEYFSYPSQIIQRELGVFISVEELSSADYYSRLATNSFDIAVAEFTGGYGDLTTILSNFETNSKGNYYNYSSQTFDQLLLTAKKQNDVMASIEAIKQCEQILISDGAVIPVYYKHDYLVSSKKFSGLLENPYTGLISFKEVRMN